MERIPYRTFAFINLRDLEENTKKIKNLLQPNTKLLSVLKADAYGHGAVKVAKTIEKYSDWFSVASFEEACELRNNGINKPILVFGFVDDSNIVEAYEKDLTITALSYEYTKHLANFCKKKKIQIQVHLKLDTGFHRLGINCCENNYHNAIEEIEELYSLNTIKITGIYTHFATAGKKTKEDTVFQEIQYQRFCRVLNELKNKKYSLGICHCCNSKATLTNPEMHLDMVRVGLYLYGLGSVEDLNYLDLRPIVTWKARIYSIKYIEKGESVGYSRTFFAKRNMRIGVVSLGFADGYSRCLYSSDNIYVLVHGKKVKILGKICMDVMMIDLTDVPEAKINDYCVVLGKDENEEISANLIGKEIGGTAVEVTCTMGKRVKRIYVEK